MSVELEFSVQANNAARMQPFRDEFEARYGIHVKLHVSDWTTAWSEVTRTALNRAGPDVSEVGSVENHAIRLHTQMRRRLILHWQHDEPGTTA